MIDTNFENKYVTIGNPHSNINTWSKGYNLPVEYLKDFREAFGISMTHIKESDFVKWCKSNNIKLCKIIVNSEMVSVDDY